ncbi:MAG: DNA polymerase III subunit beta [Oscillospiraceae bacterium]
MKFSVNKKELGDAVTNIQRAVSTKTSIPALEGILIKSVDNAISLTAYDLELGMQTIVNASIAEHGKIVLSAKLFSDIVKKAPSDSISFTIDEKNIATIESGNSNFTIIGINPEEFPELPQIGGTESLIIPGETIKSMIRQTIFAVAENDSKPIHQGSLFVADNGTLEVISVDGYRLAIRREKIDSATNTSFVVPGKTLSEVLKITGDEDVEIFPGRRYIMFQIGRYTIVSGILEGEFLDYQSAIPKQHTSEVSVKTREFIESTERVSLLISDRLKSPIRCSFEDNEIRISCTTTMGRASDELSAIISGNNVEMGFNNRYLLDALRNSECDEVKIMLTGSLNPMVIMPKEGDSFLFLVLPVRLKSE